ncbi:MAG: hypothetical protein CEN92_464 [Candidatus Berkelbacteria bacterium Licking1014_96]|uniref:Uncharacterized protein n=1 Tax=Candidatus Berkelbacteria bacterium Licking1014_96 TaxID=2017149 RepID=A0A554LC86_9BACT|nr:MAG: hypothetical protein CEN92_464 [Candidatus Berkelbacteria bacterium Licking1014_96]
MLNDSEARLISIYLVPTLPPGSCRRTILTSKSRSSMWCDFGLPSLHRTGFTAPFCHQSGEGLLKPYVSPLLRLKRRSGLVSVALSLGSPPVAVSDCPALRCSDFPLRRYVGADIFTTQGNDIILNTSCFVKLIEKSCCLGYNFNVLGRGVMATRQNLDLKTLGSIPSAPATKIYPPTRWVLF